MRTGDLKHFVEIQQFSSRQDEKGALVTAWIPYQGVWAAIWPISSKERLSMGKLQGEISHRVRIRYTPGILSTMRILFNYRVLEIVAPPINKDERNVWLEILCKETE